jgi:hypothetical protein
VRPPIAAALRFVRLDRDQTRRLASIGVLVVAALATIATEPGQARLETTVSGQIEIGGGASVTRDLTIHVHRTILDPPASGHLTVTTRSVDGTQAVDPGNLAVTMADDTGAVVAPKTGSGPFLDTDIPVAACTPSCDLSYRLTFTSTDPGSPATIFRYDVGVVVGYTEYGVLPATETLTIDVPGATPLVGQWIALGAALIGLVAGVSLGRRFARPSLLGLLPGFAVVGILAVDGVWAILLPSSLSAPRYWDAVPLIGLVAGLSWALFRWRRGDARWLSSAGWSVVIVGGVLFIGTVGLLPGYRLPELLGASVLGWCLVGIVNGQGLVAHAQEARLRRWPTTVAVISQGIILAGLLSASESFLEPFGGGRMPEARGLAAPGLVVAILVVIGLSHWLGGRGRMMLLMNIGLFLVGGVGLLGLESLSFGSPAFLVEWGPAAVLGLGACVAGAFVALRAPTRRPQMVATRFNGTHWTIAVPQSGSLADSPIGPAASTHEPSEDQSGERNQVSDVGDGGHRDRP